MIRFFKEKDIFSVISIWKEAFGDSTEEIRFFLEFLKDNLLVLEKDGKVVSMLTILKVRIGEDNGRYIYAVATDKKFRCRGYAGELIKYDKHFITDNNEKFLVLLPQEESLHNFYEKYGFSSLRCSKKLSIETENNDDMTKRARIITPEDYFLLRKSYFKDEKFVEWEIKALEFMKKAYSGDFLIIEEESITCGVSFCFKQRNNLVVAELLSFENDAENIKALGAFYGINSVHCICASKDGEKFAMIYPDEYADSYFGLGMK